MSYTSLVGRNRYRFRDLREVMAKASPLRSGDVLACVAAESAEERVAANQHRALPDRLEQEASG